MADFSGVRRFDVGRMHRQLERTRPVEKRSSERRPHGDSCIVCLQRRVKGLTRQGLCVALAAQLLDGIPLNSAEITTLEAATPEQIKSINKAFRGGSGGR